MDVAFFLVFWLSPVQHLLMTVCPYELGIPAKIVTNTRTESAFPRTSHAPLTLQSSTMSAFVRSAFTTGGSTFVRARAQTRRAPTAKVRPRISVANAHSNSRSDNTNRPYLLSSLQASGRVSLRVQAIAEGRQSLFVTVNVKPGKMEEYESLIKSHSESTKPHRSIHLTPDAHLPETEVTNCYMNDRCMYFDFGINQDGSDPNSVYLYEVYEDEAALEEHRESAHLKEYLAAAEIITSGHDVRNINLAPYGSVNCNYAGQCEIGEAAWD